MQQIVINTTHNDGLNLPPETVLAYGDACGIKLHPYVEDSSGGGLLRPYDPLWDKYQPVYYSREELAEGSHLQDSYAEDIHTLMYRVKRDAPALVKAVQLTDPPGFRIVEIPDDDAEWTIEEDGGREWVVIACL